MIGLFDDVVRRGAEDHHVVDDPDRIDRPVERRQLAATPSSHAEAQGLEVGRPEPHGFAHVRTATNGLVIEVQNDW